MSSVAVVEQETRRGEREGFLHPDEGKPTKANHKFGRTAKSRTAANSTIYSFMRAHLTNQAFHITSTVLPTATVAPKPTVSAQIGTKNI